MFVFFNTFFLRIYLHIRKKLIVSLIGSKKYNYYLQNSKRLSFIKIHKQITVMYRYLKSNDVWWDSSNNTDYIAYRQSQEPIFIIDKDLYIIYLCKLFGHNINLDFKDKLTRLEFSSVVKNVYEKKYGMCKNLTCRNNY